MKSARPRGREKPIICITDYCIQSVGGGEVLNGPKHPVNCLDLFLYKPIRRILTKSCVRFGDYILLPS